MLDFLWGAFAIDAELFGLWRLVSLFAWLWLGAFVYGNNIFGLDIEVPFGFDIDLPSATVLVPGGNQSLFAVELIVFLEASDEDLASDRDELIGVVFIDGLDPVFLQPSLSPSWDDVILFGNLPELPNFKVLDIFEQFGHLVEGIITMAGLDG